MAQGLTAPMKVDKLGFLVDRLGEDCSPLQYLRELTQNSIEAIGRTPDGVGEVIWDVDWNTLDLRGVYKLSITDTGQGMTGEDLERFINHLSASVQEQSFEGNYGVGAKIAGATRNHAGMLYLSWRDDRGSMSHLWRDSDLGEYGFKRFELDDGNYSEVPVPDEALKPGIIGEHGTVVVLLGNAEDENTMRPPEGTPYPSQWISRYLNTRYFKFPDGVKVKAREFARSSEEGWPTKRTDQMSQGGAMLRTVEGQSAFLERVASTSGTVPLIGATAYWWILDDAKTGVKHFVSSGHVAALWQDELYEMQLGKSGTSRLQEFGIIFGFSRVVIYVEPRGNGAGKIRTNTARTQLLLDHEPLPWTQWAAEFRRKLPDELQELINDAAPISSNHLQNIRNRLKQIEELFKYSRYRPAKRGNDTIDPESPLVGGDEAMSEGSPHVGSSVGGGSGGGLGSVYALFATQDGDPAEETVTLAVPAIDWVSVKDGSRVASDMEDRAAKYLPEQNRLLVNADFRGFTDMKKRWVERYSDFPTADAAVQVVAEEWFGQQLIETVLGVHALKGARYWTAEDIGNALSEEALTAAVMPRYHVDKQMGRSLGQRVGSLKEKAVG